MLLAMTSSSDNTLQHSILSEGLLNKRKRRSSIFRPETTELTTFRSQNYDYKFPQSYLDKLTCENDKWKEAYLSIQNEYLELRKKAKQNTCDITITNLGDYEHYLKQVEDFCCRLNNIVEVQIHIANLRNIKQSELKHLLKLIHLQTQQRLNI